MLLSLHPARRPCPAPSTCAALRRWAHQRRLSGRVAHADACSLRLKIRNPTVAPAPGPDADMLPSAAWPLGERDSRFTMMSSAP